MAAKKCPLCGGKIILEYCDACGFRVPDEKNISALYDLTPDSYPTYVENNSDFIPASMEREAALDLPPPPPIQVSETLRSVEFPQRSPYRSPYQTPNQTGRNAKHENEPHGNSSIISDFIKDAWWKVLITLFIPFAGILFCFQYLEKSNENPKYSVYFVVFMIAVTVIAFGLGFSRF
ncbi:MAG: hypothetical protein FWG90_09885 [Oscillospiraceae bacterium]|nr:hypothetical protein [Oscillospiraceae bacterium]